MAWTAEQRKNAAIVYRVGLQLGASLRDIQVAISAAIVESGLRNLDYGDRDSIGMFQQRDAWGSREARLNPYQSAKMFFLGGAQGQEGLLDIDNRDSRSIGSLAQDVQVSAFPERYGEVADEAGSLLKGIDPSAELPDEGSFDSAGIVSTSYGEAGGGEGQPVEPDGPPPYAEVDGVGAVTADETGIGALTFGEQPEAAGSGSPVGALTFEGGALGDLEQPDPASGGSGGGGSPAGGGYTSGGGAAPSGGFDQFMDDYFPGGGTPGPGQTTIAAASFQGKDPHELVTVDGEVLDNMTLAALQAAQKEYGADFHVMQGGHSHYGASGNTHAGLGVVDLSVPDGQWEAAMTALRKIGFAAWVRNVPGYGYAGSGAHIHAVLKTNPDLSPEAAIQVQSYLNNDDGLAGSRRDDGPRDYVNNEFLWESIDGGNKPKRRGNRDVVDKATTLLGVPFRWGGQDYTGMDAVGFIRKAYEGTGMEVPSYFNLVNLASDAIPAEEIAPGDLVAWDEHPATGDMQVGIYVGDGQYVTAYGPGAAVQMNLLDATGAIVIPGPTQAIQSFPGAMPPSLPQRNQGASLFPNGTSSESPNPSGAELKQLMEGGVPSQPSTPPRPTGSPSGGGRGDRDEGKGGGGRGGGGGGGHAPYGHGNLPTPG